MSIIDGYSRMVWVYTLKNKNQALSKFKEWITLQENLMGNKIKYLRTDNGLEYCSNEFTDYCKTKGIARYLTAPGTPQQNGLTEMMNRNIIERVRCMLSLANLPKSYWAEGMEKTCHLIKRSPSIPIDFLTPRERCSGEPPNLKHLKVFGCKAYGHAKLGKLDARAVNCVFIGYPEVVKGYMIRCIELGMERTLVIGMSPLLKMSSQ